MTELQNIALIYESMIRVNESGFVTGFSDLPEEMPYGAWVAQDGSFCTVDGEREGHAAVIKKMLDQLPNGKSILDYWSKNFYTVAYIHFKFTRVVFDGYDKRPEHKILYYEFPDKKLISRKALDTIRDLAMMYDLRVVPDCKLNNN